MSATKPLGRKAYGSIPHLPDSRLGPSDSSINDGQARILTEQTRDFRDIVIVTQKLDGSCCAVANVDNDIIPLNRVGYPAMSSPYPQHHLFAEWVDGEESRFRALLRSGEWVAGEWLAQAHGTLYDLVHEPFVIFDIFDASGQRMCYETVLRLAHEQGFITPQLVSYGQAICVPDALKRLRNIHGAQEEIEGVVYRVERDGAVDFLAKFVRHDKVDGKYLFDAYAVWNNGLSRYLPRGIR